MSKAVNEILPKAVSLILIKERLENKRKKDFLDLSDLFSVASGRDQNNVSRQPIRISGFPPADIRTAQNFTSGIFPKGSSTEVVIKLAAASL